MEYPDLTPRHVARPHPQSSLGLLHTVLTEVGFAADTTAALKAVLRLISEEGDWLVGQAWLPDDEQTLARDAVWVSDYSQDLHDFLLVSGNLKFEPGKDLIGRARAIKKPVWIPDLTHEQYFRRLQEAQLAGLRSALAIPVLAGSDVVAVLEFFRRDRLDEDEQQTVFLATVAAQLGWILLHKREQDALRASEERYRVLIENAPICIHEIDREKRLTAVNPAGLQMLGGLNESQVRGFSALNLVSTADQSRIEKLLDAAFEGTYSEFEFVTAEGLDESRTFLSNFVPVREKDGTVRKVIGTSQDITARKRSEEQLRQSQKMEALGRLAGGIAHDFNNILNVIIGHAYLLQGDYSPERVRHGAVEIRKAADRATSLTRQMLAFSRKSVVQLEPKDLNTIIVSMSDMLRRLIGEHIDLRVSIGKDVPCVTAEAGHIEQIIMNLAVNSRDAMSNGGSLTISTHPATLSDEEATPLGLTGGTYAVLTVEDTGQGMDEKTQAHAFEPFFTTKDAEKGTGIGLATVYGIVKQRGGSVSLRSRVGAGTTVTILLPASDKAAAETQFDEVRTSGAIASGTILLVEDEESVRALTKQLLQNEGYSVLEAPNGATALEIVATHRGKIDLLLTDVVMPGMRGFEFASHLRHQRPGIKILYVSGYNEPNMPIDKDAMALEKPFTPGALSETIRSLLASTQEREQAPESSGFNLSTKESARSLLMLRMVTRR